MKKMEDYFVPWLKGVPMYISSHIELAWKDKSLKRLMSNENPNPPSKKVQKALTQYAAVANRYMDQGLLVRSKIAQLNGLAGPENVLVGNGSSEVFDMIFRTLLQVGDEVIQHTPCFGIYKLRTVVCGGKLVSVPMRYENKRIEFDAKAVLAFCPETVDPQCRLHVRVFCDFYDVPEDPATGSAAVALAAALAHDGESAGTMTVDQGDEVGAPSRIEVMWGGGMVAVGGGVRRDEVRVLER